MNKPLVIITGASSGLGAAMAQAFSAAGYPLGLLARNVDAIQRTKVRIESNLQKLFASGTSKG